MLPFNNEKYLQEQTKHIMERVGASGQRLYLEFGGKLIGDFHAARVLPGFDPNVKMQLLQNLSANADIIICIHAGDIERKKIRADLGITYDNDAMRLIDDLRNRNVNIAGVVITRFNGQPSALEFKRRLEKYGIGVFLHREIAGYPDNFDYIVSENGFGSNPYIPVKQPLVVVTGPGPNSGKMGTCLSQIYHEYRLGNQAHYAKFETFPVWNLPLNHPVNIAYEAATADLQDANALDHFHYDAYNIVSVNYNRDLQAFPLLKSLLSRITGKECPYQSPTDMGVNCIKAGIIDDEAVSEAAKLEIERRYFRIKADYMLGRAEESTFNRIVEIVGKSKVDPEQRDVVVAARKAAEQAAERDKDERGIHCGAAIKLPDGTIITGKNSSLMHAAAAMFLNAAKHLAGIADSQHLLLPEILEDVANFKAGLGSLRQSSLNLSETLITLVASCNRDTYAQQAIKCMPQFHQCDMHLSHIPSTGDEDGLRRLGINYTYDPVKATKNLFK